MLEHSGGVGSVPTAVEVAVVPVPATIVVAIEVEEVPVAVRVAEKYIECHPCHHPSNTLRVEYYFAS